MMRFVVVLRHCFHMYRGREGQGVVNWVGPHTHTHAVINVYPFFHSLIPSCAWMSKIWFWSLGWFSLLHTFRSLAQHHLPKWVEGRLTVMKHGRLHYNINLVWRKISAPKFPPSESALFFGGVLESLLFLVQVSRFRAESWTI